MVPRTSLARIVWVAACSVALIASTSPAVAAADPPAAALQEQRPAPITVLTLNPGTAPGLLFLTVQSPRVAYLHGPQILDNQGRPIWFRGVGEQSFATSFRVQTYRGQEVLTWWEGTADNLGRGEGVGYIADSNYRIIATIRDQEPLDFHEFRLTPQGTAIVMLQRKRPFDLTPFGGPADGSVLDNGIREIDISTGEIVREWWSQDHIPVSETDWPPEEDTLDYFHMNSISLDFDGHYLVTARHTNTVYKVHRYRGEIIWRLGGDDSDFVLGDGAEFKWQHDAESAGRNIYRIFDNSASRPTPGKKSRVVWIKVDPVRRTASLLRAAEHPQPLLAIAQGGSQRLPNRNTFVSWGSAGRISEFSSDGSLVFDAALPPQHSSYRAYRFPWRGHPLTQPAVTLADDGATVHAVWNGATQVVRWRVLGGPTQTDLRTLVEAMWNGLDTPIALPDGLGAELGYLKVQALDGCHRVIGASPVTPTGH
jgi:hypothetical protein